MKQPCGAESETYGRSQFGTGSALTPRSPGPRRSRPGGTVGEFRGDPLGLTRSSQPMPRAMGSNPAEENVRLLTVRRRPLTAFDAAEHAGTVASEPDAPGHGERPRGGECALMTVRRRPLASRHPAYQTGSRRPKVAAGAGARADGVAIVVHRSAACFDGFSYVTATKTVPVGGVSVIVPWAHTGVTIRHDLRSPCSACYNRGLH
jgi:hypothetical protein